MKKYVIPVVFSLVFGALFVPDFSYAQSCFDGSSWEGPGANPPLANRTKPIYSSCSDAQDITSDLNFTGMIDVVGTNDADEVFEISHIAGPATASFAILHDATNIEAANIGITSGSLGLYVRRTTGGLVPSNSSGAVLRVQDITFNPEIQLQYGTSDPDEHWSIYANGISDDSLRFWSYNGGLPADRMMITQDGKVGIGGEPEAALHVRSTAYMSQPTMFGTQIGSGTLELVRNGTPYIDFLNDAGSSNDYDARIMLRANDLLTVEGANLHVRYTSQQGSHALAVNGTSYFGNSISIVDGTEANGYVLVSDASGNASWSDITSVPGSSYWTLSGTDLYANTATWAVGVGTSDPFDSVDFHVGDTAGGRLLISREESSGVTTGDWLGQIMFESLDGGYSSVDAPVVLRALAGESQDDQNKGGQYEILTKDDDRNEDESAQVRFMIDEDGDIFTGSEEGGSLTVDLGNNSSNGFYVTRWGTAEEGLRTYATDRDLYMIYNEDTGEPNPGDWHFINQESDGGLTREFMTAYYNTTDDDTYVGIHDTTPDYPLDVGGDVGAVTYYATSDERLKDDIVALDYEMDTIMKLRPVTFTWKKDVQNMPVHGLIAQDVEMLYPYIVSTNGEGYKSVSYDQFIPVLIKGMQEQQEYIDELEARLERLEQAVYAK
ncbi:MAG: tail fiber domain-containing protein [Patescibacteria group bacterium]